MSADVVTFDLGRRRNRPAKKDIPTECGQLLTMDRLSDGVIQRQIARQTAWELEQLKFLFKVTGGDPDQLPTPDQIRGFYEDGLEL
jgi:hypothetical protein